MCCPQVLGLFTVTATTLGTLYLVDADNIADTQGLNVVGVLLLILNATFAVLMALLIMAAARQSLKKYAAWAYNAVKTAGCGVKGRPRVNRQWSRLSKTASGDTAVSPSGSTGLSRSASSPTQQMALVPPHSSSPMV